MLQNSPLINKRGVVSHRQGVLLLLRVRKRAAPRPALRIRLGTTGSHIWQWKEWNFRIERERTHTLGLSVNYVGNHGSRIPYTNAWPNAFDEYGIFPGVPGIAASAPVPNYGTVTQIQSGAISNYDGMTATLTKRFSYGLVGHLNYTWFGSTAPPTALTVSPASPRRPGTSSAGPATSIWI